jgi:hypothetical protein
MESSLFDSLDTHHIAATANIAAHSGEISSSIFDSAYNSHPFSSTARRLLVLLVLPQHRYTKWKSKGGSPLCGSSNTKSNERYLPLL